MLIKLITPLPDLMHHHNMGPIHHLLGYLLMSTLLRRLSKRNGVKFLLKSQYGKLKLCIWSVYKPSWNPLEWHSHALPELQTYPLQCRHSGDQLHWIPGHIRVIFRKNAQWMTIPLTCGKQINLHFQWVMQLGLVLYSSGCTKTIRSLLANKNEVDFMVVSG
jgi:hypothetical protein